MPSSAAGEDHLTTAFAVGKLGAEECGVPVIAQTQFGVEVRLIGFAALDLLDDLFRVLFLLDDLFCGVRIHRVPALTSFVYKTTSQTAPSSPSSPAAITRLMMKSPIARFVIGPGIDRGLPAAAAGDSVEFFDNDASSDIIRETRGSCSGWIVARIAN